MRHWLILGSNQQRAPALRFALSELRRHCGLLQYAPARRTGGRPAYLNAGLLIESGASPIELRTLLRAIETDAGRVRGRSLCRLDIDLVASQDGEGAVQVHKPGDLARDYVRALLGVIGLAT